MHALESPGRRLAAARKLAGNFYEGFKERLEKFRSVKIFMDICVRCGACSDKCHFFIGTGDPKNMPVLRAELLRSVYRNNFTRFGKILGRLAGRPPHDPGCA
jgi:ferredoxin